METTTIDFSDLGAKPHKEPAAPAKSPQDHSDLGARPHGTPAPPATPPIARFPIDKHIDEQLKSVPPEKRAESRNSLASVWGYLIRPWKATGFSAMAALDRGTAEFFENIDLMDRWFHSKGIGPEHGISRTLADIAEKDSKHWSERAQQVGVNFIDELVGEAVGGAAPGMANFILQVDSGYTLPAIVGAEKAREAGTSPFIGAIVEAGKTATLHHLLRMAAPYSRYIQGTVMGSAFAGQAAIEAPEGQKLKAAIKGGAAGAAFGMISPGENTLKDVYANVGRSVPEIRAELSAAEKQKQGENNLRPALQLGDQVIAGEPGETHPDIIARQSVSRETQPGPAPESKPGAPAGQPAEISDQARQGQGRTEPDAPSSSTEWARENAPEIYEEAKRRTEMRMRGEDPGELPRGEATKRTEVDYTKPLGIAQDLGSAGRGFIGPDGRFMGRTEAKFWVKENQPDVYAKWATLTGSEDAEFHSEDYAEAAGISTQPISGIPNDPDIGHLNTVLKTMPKGTGLKQRISAAEKEAATHTGPLAKAQDAWGKIKSIGTALSDWYFSPPGDATFDVMFGKYIGSREISGMKTEQWAKQIQDTIPRDRQEAITKWIRTNGDRDELQRRASESKDPKAAKKYQDALSLTPDELKLAQNIRAYYDRMLDRAIHAGVLETGINDYVNRVYKVRPKAVSDSGQKLASQASAGLLQKNPGFAKKRFYEHDWEAEQEGGELEDRIGYLVAIYQQSFDEAIAARTFVKDLASGKAQDGRPLVAMRGSGHALPRGDEPPQAYVINPKSRPKPKGFEFIGEGQRYPSETNFGDYKNIDHPALRAHKWVTQDADGNPVYLDADMIVHPEAYDRLNNLLKRSAIQQSKVGSAMLKGSGLVKGTILGFFSSFHQVHLAQHTLTHGVSPFSPEEIDFNNPMHKDLIEHGLKLYDGDALNEFMEGIQGPGLIKYIPKVGDWAQAYTDYLFKAPTGYIPRLKVKLASELFERNSKQYPELSRDQALFLSADQANAALGGQNYKLMGRNKTAQDLFRLAGLAPDFLESRAKFVGQAFKPYGHEQFTAMAIRGAIGMYAMAKLFEGIGAIVDPDKNKVHWDEPFSATLWGRSYSIRSVQGDLFHAWKDPRSFIYNRLNPALIRPAIEGVTGRDQFGRVKDGEGQLKDYLKGSLPIAGQGFFTRRDFNLYQSILQSMGISSWDYRTEAQQLMRQKQMAKSEGPAPDETKERRATRIELTDKFARTKDPAEIRKALAEKRITPKDVIKIFSTALEGDLKTGIKGLTLPESLDIWKAANDEEKAGIQKAIVEKWLGWDATEKERVAFEDRYNDVLSWRAKPGQKKPYSILNRK